MKIKGREKVIRIDSAKKVRSRDVRNDEKLDLSGNELNSKLLKNSFRNNPSHQLSTLL